MKIGAVCELTKLSDRTVRYYIEEGLLQPQYTKNYIGRKSFDFSDGDVALLQDIAVLRKYGFSIIDIKTMLDDPTQSAAITRQLTEKKQQTIQSEQAMLDALLRLEAGKNYTVPELATALDLPPLSQISPPKDSEIPFFTYITRLVFWAFLGIYALLLIIIFFTTTLENTHDFLYIKYYSNWSEIIYPSLLFFLLPFALSGFMLLISTRKLRKKPILQGILTVIVTVAAFLSYLPCLLIGSFTAHPLVYSETKDIKNYMQVGGLESSYKSIFLLFPEQVPAHALGETEHFLPDTTRYYNLTESKFFDSRFELFAQWQLSPEELEAEKERLRENFRGTPRSYERNEEWVCWIFTADSLPILNALTDYGPQEYGSYNCLCFAYRPRDGLVRYIASYSPVGGIPVFMQLDWS